MQAPSTAKPPVVIIRDSSEFGGGGGDDDIHKKKRAKRQNQIQESTINESDQEHLPKVLHPASNELLADMLHPLPKRDFLMHHFRKDAVHIQRSPHSQTSEMLVSDICSNYLFDLDVRQIFAETSSENVFLWLRPVPSNEPTSTRQTLNSVEIDNPETAYQLHMSGRHAAYCRAPPLLEQHLVGSLLRATGLGGGHYHPPHAETVTLGEGTTLGRGEVELFISAPSSSDGNVRNAEMGNNKHTTGFHTDFQENFTIQLSGIKRWTLRRGRVRHPLRGTTPHYARETSVVENQLKIARLSCLGGNADKHEFSGAYGLEYDDNNAYGPEQTVELRPGDVLYFPAGMWHQVDTVEPGISCNVSLMGTTHATLVCEALQSLMVSSDEGWREIVVSRPGEEENGVQRLQGLLGGLSELVDNFVNKQGGARSLLPPALCHPPLEHAGGEVDQNSDSSDDQSGPMMNMEDNNETEGDDLPSSGIIVDMGDFKGPPGWKCSRPPKAKLVKNPLASLMAMSDITGHSSNSDNENEVATKQYVLNVNYAGNEMMESHIRVILESSNPELIDFMKWLLSFEAEGRDPCEDRRITERIPPCLFYYGYFSWSGTA